MALRRALDYLSGNLTRKTLLFVSLPLIWLSYFGTLVAVICFSPQAYDWRHKAISRLLYPRNNPEFHLLASSGIALAGLLMIPFAGYIRRRLRSASPIAADAGAVAFGAGAVCLILAGLIVSHPYRGNSSFPRLHQMLARGSAIALGIGMLLFWMCAVKGFFAKSVSETLYRPGLLASWSLLTLPAISIVILRLIAHFHFGWPNSIYQALLNPRIWHLGFLEWTGSAAVFLFLVSSVLFLERTGTHSWERPGDAGVGHRKAGRRVHNQ